ncbi:MAG: DUF6873 family GME fold protein [Eubacteriales bacterium]
MISIVSEDLGKESCENLLKITDKIVFIRRYTRLYPAIMSHADIQCFPIDGQCLVVHPSLDKATLEELDYYKVKIQFGQKSLSLSYPNNIHYNCAKVGNKFIHHREYTDDIVIKEGLKRGIEFIHTKQGYSKCSTLIVDDNSIITADRGIAKAAKSHGIDALFITPGHIILPGFKEGFIGGAGGVLLQQNEVIFNGNIRLHPDFQRIHNFIMEKGMKYQCLSSGPLIDIGSIFFIA